ncbi:protein of unknown function [Methanoculleus bourgensis]|uniref:Uncharacterized protein n=1 Tax=Methanoculleus bourgensis TaxID=83986 RepID=A0A120N6W4_9EURY|nr:protein of unknown function [Methanoculleus bourgensis]
MRGPEVGSGKRCRIRNPGEAFQLTFPMKTAQVWRVGESWLCFIVSRAWLPYGGRGRAPRKIRCNGLVEHFI